MPRTAIVAKSTEKSPSHISLRARLSALALCVALVGCAGQVNLSGNLLDPELVAQLKPGVQSRDQVAQMLGSPSSVGVFDQESWYYVSQRMETTAFFRPEVAERQVVIVRFNAKGMVSEVRTLDISAGKVIENVERETPTAGNELTIIDQIIGNVGRFQTEP